MILCDRQLVLAEGGLPQQVVEDPESVGIVAETVPPREVFGHRLRALHDVESEVESVPTEDVAHVRAADDDELEPVVLGHEAAGMKLNVTVS